MDRRVIAGRLADARGRHDRVPGVDADAAGRARKLPGVTVADHEERNPVRRGPAPRRGIELLGFDATGASGRVHEEPPPLPSRGCAGPTSWPSHRLRLGVGMFAVAIAAGGYLRSARLRTPPPTLMVHPNQRLDVVGTAFLSRRCSTIAATKSAMKRGEEQYLERLEVVCRQEGGPGGCRRSVPHPMTPAGENSAKGYQP